MLKPSELELLADKIAKKLHRLNDEVLSVAEVARMLDKTDLPFLSLSWLLRLTVAHMGFRR